jgi:hypothetical protein
LINKPAFGFRVIVALQLSNSKAGHSKEWFSEPDLWLKNILITKKNAHTYEWYFVLQTSHLFHNKVKDKMLQNVKHRGSA